MKQFSAAIMTCVLLLLGSGCTTINTTTLPSIRNGKDVFVTAGDIAEPHDVLGIVQLTRSGVLLFGFIDVIGTDLDAGFKEVLIPHIKQMGGDGAVRARFHMTQYPLPVKVFAAVFFVAPLPSEVTITAQIVKLRRRSFPAPSVPPKPLDGGDATTMRCVTQWACAMWGKQSFDVNDGDVSDAAIHGGARAEHLRDALRSRDALPRSRDHARVRVRARRRMRSRSLRDRDREDDHRRG